MGFPRGERKDLLALERRRMQAVKLLEKGLSQSEVARRVGAHRQSVSRWAAILRDSGKSALHQADRVGPRPRLTAQDLERIELRLRQGPRYLGYQNDVWTRKAVVDLIEEECGVRYHRQYVGVILRQIGWSLKLQRTYASVLMKKGLF
jgi:transposase